MSAYAIADRFPEEARRYAAGLNYEIQPYEDDLLRARVGTRLFCPLGACLHFLGAAVQGAPCSEEVREVLVGPVGVESWRLENYLDDPDVSAINAAATAFIHDWDAGAIDNLADALGVAD